MTRRGKPDRYQITTQKFETVTLHHMKDLRTGVEMGLLSDTWEETSQEVAEAMFKLAYCGSLKDDDPKTKLRIRLRRRKA